MAECTWIWPRPWERRCPSRPAVYRTAPRRWWPMRHHWPSEWERNLIISLYNDAFFLYLHMGNEKRVAENHLRPNFLCPCHINGFGQPRRSPGNGQNGMQVVVMMLRRCVMVKQSQLASWLRCGGRWGTISFGRCRWRWWGGGGCCRS